MFRSLRGHNYRVWAAGALVSNVGTWMQRIGQDWLVLTGLTHNNATSLGVVMALQYAPQLLLLPWTGFAADHFDRRRLLMATQAAMGVLALALGLLTVTGQVQLWQVYIFAFLFGSAAAFDAPARLTFVSDMVDETNLANAVALNSTSFSVARMIGPAIAGVLIATVGSGWVFLINAASYGAVLASILFMRPAELMPSHRAARTRGSLLEGFRYIWRRPDLRVVVFMLFWIGTFGFNFPIFISTMAVKVFHAGAGKYGLLTSLLAIGTIAGALLAARRTSHDIKYLLAGASLFGVGCALAAFMPNYGLFGLSLLLVGVAAMSFMTATNTVLQLTTELTMRGRVMAIRVAVSIGGTTIGAPIVGWVGDRFGPRWSLAIAAAAGLVASAIAIRYLVRSRRLGGQAGNEDSTSPGGA